MPLDYTYNRMEAVDLLKRQLDGDDARFRHSLGVEQTSVDLAKHYGADMSKAGLAGLVHDIAKHMDNKELRHKYGLASPTDKTLHGQVGAAWLFENGYVLDEDVLNAIRYHTTGREAMNDIEKIVYLADVTEPGRRSYPGVERVRELMWQDLDEAMLYTLHLSIQQVLDKNEPVDPYTVEAYNYYWHRAKQRREREGKQKK